MLRVKRKPGGMLFIAIGAQRVEWGVFANGQWVPESAREARIEFIQGVAAPVDALTAVLGQMEADVDQWRAAQSGDAAVAVREVRAVVADSWLAVAGVPWSSSLQRAATAESFARGQLGAAGFELAVEDAVKLDDAPFGLPRLAVAYPAQLRAALHKLAEHLGARLSSILPLSAAAWAGLPGQHHGQLHALAVRDEGLLLVGHGAGYMTDVTVRAAGDSGSDVASDAQTLSGLWQRMRLRDPQLLRVEKLPVLNLRSAGGPLPDAGSDLVGIEMAAPGGVAMSPRLHLAALTSSLRLPLDAVPAGSSMTPKRWLVAGVALALAATMAAEAWQTSGQARALADKLVAVQNAQRTVPDSTTWSREETTRVRAVNGAIRALNLPISALLRALLPPRDIRVAVLSVEVMGASSASAGQTSGVKIVAEARTGAEMARYVGFVAERKPFTGAYLTQHEINESMAERPYRFTVEAIWSD